MITIFVCDMIEPIVLGYNTCEVAIVDSSSSIMDLFYT